MIRLVLTASFAIFFMQTVALGQPRAKRSDKPVAHPVHKARRMSRARQAAKDRLPRRHRRDVSLRRGARLGRGLGGGSESRSAEEANRGSLATLEGIERGQRIELKNPSTGEIDKNARVLWTEIDTWSNVPSAEVEFSNGHVGKFAAERIHLADKNREFRERYIRKHKERIFDAIEKQLGERPDGVKFELMDGPTERIDGNSNLGPFLSEFNSLTSNPLRPGESLAGFSIEDRAVINKNFAAFDLATPTHEVLHAMSEPFVDQMQDRGMIEMMEGITEHLTYRVVEPHFRVEPDPAAIPDVNVGKQIADLVGQRRLEELFFGREPGLVDKLAREVDRAVGKEGAFERAARQLERGQSPSALEGSG